LLAEWRSVWAEWTNDALAEAGAEARVDHRTLAEQGIGREPQPKIGAAAMAMERRGEVSERGAAWRAVMERNQVAEIGRQEPELAERDAGAELGME
jgi:hypothetical protein